MLKRVSLWLILGVLILSLILPGCGGSPDSGNTSSPAVVPAEPRGLTGTISAGKTVAAATVPVSPSGGTISVSEAGTPITGLELVIPPDSYPDKRDFKISYALIEKHSFGEYLNPITPLITVENGGEYSAEDMQITLPVTIPEGKFAMGFLYNDKTKILEGMPLLAESASSITVATRHFSSFVISLIDKTKLKKDIDTGFRPGIDDWQFVNHGSFIAPGGHCAGQSISAMWYYYTQPDGKDLTLYGRYDNNGKQPATPKLDQDDSLGYRLASMVQSDLDWDSWASKLFAEQRGLNDELAWNAFAYSMQFTGQPQYVTLGSNLGGHAIICYRIKDGQLYVADPNYPGNTERRIEYLNSKFTPYESGLNKAEIDAGKSIKFDKIGYVAQSSRVDWKKMNQRWAEFKNRTIGNDKFPAYKIKYVDEDGKPQELQDGTIFTSQKARFLYDFNGAVEGVTIWRDGAWLAYDAAGAFELKKGNNELGFYVTKTANGKPKFVDFQYLNVVYGGLALKPATQEMEPNIQRSFNLELEEGAPKDSHFEWFVDGELKQTGYDFIIHVSFPDEGRHTIICKIVSQDGKVITQAQGTAVVKAKASPSPTITGNNLTALQAMKSLRVSTKGKWTFKITNASGETTKDSFFNYTIPWYATQEEPTFEINWSGTSFTGKKTWGSSKNGGTSEAKGAVSADGKIVTSLEWKYSSRTDNGESDSPWYIETTQIIKLKDIPVSQLVFETSTSKSFTFQKGGPDIKNYVVEISYRSATYRGGSVSDETVTVPDSIIWDCTEFQGTPTIYFGLQAK